MRVIGFALMGEQQDIASCNRSSGVLPYSEQVVQLHPIFVGQTDFVYQSHNDLLLFRKHTYIKEKVCINFSVGDYSVIGIWRR
jgi:hypothetical protein